MMRDMQVGSLLLALVLAGCGNPYGLSVNSANYEAAPTPGSITFTEPKLYRREALINERRGEHAYLSKLIEDSPSALFAPEITRQLEVVRTISASLNLKFDPALGVQYRRSEEKADIQQQLDMLGLQMQLDKLKRDSELLKDQLTKQTEPSADSGKPQAGAGGAGAGGASKPEEQTTAITALTAAIDQLRSQLTTSLGTNITAITPLNVVNPMDQFNDRAVYREMLNGARNAASLDELHDRDGASLIRLNVTATVFPPAKPYRETFGRLRMQVEAPNKEGGSPEFKALYWDWLAYLSTKLSQAEPVKGRYPLTPLGNAMAQQGDLLNIVWVEFSTSPGSDCRGLSIAADEAPRKSCLVMPIAAPPVEIEGASRTYNTSLQLLAGKFADRGIDYPALMRMLADDGGLKGLFNADCTLNTAVSARPIALAAIPAEQWPTARQVVTLAFALEKLTEVGPFVDGQLLAITSKRRFPQIYYASYNAVDPIAVAQARRIVDQIRTSDIGRQCGAQLSQWLAFDVPQAFLARLTFGKPSVYQVGPKQQVQIVSTEARAAEAFALAASVAAQAPPQGIGGNAGFNFARSALGKVDALERVPLVVGYGDALQASGPSQDGRAGPVFGWMMGPRAVVDSEHQKLIWQQGLRPQELSVDLIVPGWWPYLTIVASSTWSPDWAGRGGKAGTEGEMRRLKVMLSPTSADYDQITNQILGGSSLKLPYVQDVLPRRLPACASGIAIQLRGPQLWRADKVVIGGAIYDQTAVEVLPGLEGVLVKNVSSQFPIMEATGGSDKTERRVGVTALTPYGAAEGVLFITDVKPAGCQTNEGGAAAGKPAAGAKE